MERGDSPNEVLTPTYIGEQLFYVPLLVYYMGELAVAAYIRDNKDTIKE